MNLVSYVNLYYMLHALKLLIDLPLFVSSSSSPHLNLTNSCSISYVISSVKSFPPHIFSLHFLLQITHDSNSNSISHLNAKFPHPEKSSTTTTITSPKSTTTTTTLLRQIPRSPRRLPSLRLLRRLLLLRGVCRMLHRPSLPRLS